MLFNLKLWQKGLILVAVPLTFELMFVAALTVLLKQAEVEIWQERHARAVVTECERLVKNFVDAGVLFFVYRATKSQAILTREEELAAEIPQQFQALSILLRDSPHQAESLDKLQIASSRALELINSERSLVENEKVGLTRKHDRSEFTIMSSQLIIGLRQFVKEQSSIQDVNPQDEARTRFLIVECLAAGVAFNILLALSLAILFNQGTARRLSLLMDNTLRLTRHEPLHKEMSGSDEIAQLDHVFHEMSEALADASRRKQELMSMVTHDLRTPLTSIQATLTLFAEGVMGELNPKAKQKIELAERNVLRLIQLINDLLDIEKLEAGMMQVARRETDLDSILRRAVDSVQALADQNTVKIDVSSTNLAVFADEDRLVQVLVNLLSNALKYSPPESTITVGHQVAGRDVEITVQDQGPGIPIDFQKKIFERFQQVDPGDEKARKGTGLGLPICKALIEAHAGSIGVRSEVGCGSTFWLRIPLKNPRIDSADTAQN
jgi:signal transduction histidine kinase